MSQLVPGLRLLRFALRLVLDTVDDGREEAIQPSLDVVYLNLFEGLPDRLLALLVGEPRRRTLRQFNVKLDSEGYHRFPEFAVMAAVKFQVHHVATSTTPVAMISAGWVDVKRGRLVLMVRQRTATREPCSPAERFQLSVPACDLLDWHCIANGLATLAEAERGFMWASLYNFVWR
jgi:hypothetical protein